MILPTTFALLSLFAVTASAQKKCSLTCPKSKALQPPGKKCIPCPPPNAAKVRADGDPHVSVTLAVSVFCISMDFTVTERNFVSAFCLRILCTIVRI